MARQLLKLTFILLVILLETLIVGFVFRNHIALKLANHYLSKHQIALPCADFSLTPSLDININQLCLNHPLAKTELHGVKVQWSMFPVTINNVQLERIDIKGAGKLGVNKKADDTPFAPQDFHKIMADMSALTLPAAINIDQFVYQPFNRTEQYKGQITASNSGILWALTDTQNTPIFAGQLSTTGESLKGSVKTDFVLMRGFFRDHNIQAPEKFDDLIDVSGQLSTQFDWQAKKFTAHNQLDNLSISSTQGLFDSGPFAIKTNQAWQTTLDNNQFKVQINKPTPITVDINEQALLDLLVAKKMPPQLITLLKDNPIQGLTLIPQGAVDVDLSQEKLSLSALTINSHNKQSPLNIELANLQLPFDQNPISADFEVNTTAKVSALAAFTTTPVDLQTKGSVTKSPDGIKLQFAPGSQVKLSKIKLAKATEDKPDILLAAAQSNWQGTLNIGKKAIKADIKTETQLHQLFAKKWVKVALTHISSHIKGAPDDISIEGKLITDDIPLAQFKVTGDIKKPVIDISGKDIQLIDLLGLNLNKAFEIELIDGAVDYAVSGQLTDFKAIDQNPLTLSLNVKDISGEVEKTWLQEMSWQQQFKLEKGNLTTNATQPNFSLGLVEVGGEITEIKATTNLARIQQAFSFKLDNVSGKAFDGTFAIPAFNWPSNPDKPLMLQLDGIDLEKLVALEKQKGIVVTGRISGLLPVYLEPDGVTINEGELHNITDGLIQIMDNPAVQELKQSRTELKLAFDALQNLHYHQLTSTVTMTKDGQMLLETAIKGKNPDLDNDVNFNLNLDYDLLGLIQSARITESFEQSITDNIQQE